MIGYQKQFANPTVGIINLICINHVPVSVAYAEHLFENNEAFAQYLDISQISAEKFVMTVDDDSHDMYYGYSGSIDSMGSDKPHPYSHPCQSIRKENHWRLPSAKLEKTAYFG